MIPPPTANESPRVFYASWAGMHKSLSEAKDWIPKAEHEDIRYYVLKDEYDRLAEEYTAFKKHVNEVEDAGRKLWEEKERLAGELAEARAQLKDVRMQNERMMNLDYWCDRYKIAVSERDRYQAAYELALYYVEGDATYEGVKEKCERLIRGEIAREAQLQPLAASVIPKGNEK